jgi:hypothetical protein
MALSSALYVALAVTALKLGWGTAGLAAGATVWLLARVVTTGGRFLGTGWLAR